MFSMEWWRPKHTRQHAIDDIQYQQCFKANKTWERDPSFLKGSTHWQTTTSAMYGFKSRMKEKKHS